MTNALSRSVNRLRSSLSRSQRAPVPMPLRPTTMDPNEFTHIVAAAMGVTHAPPPVPVAWDDVADLCPIARQATAKTMRRHPAYRGPDVFVAKPVYQLDDPCIHKSDKYDQANGWDMHTRTPIALSGREPFDRPDPSVPRVSAIVASDVRRVAMVTPPGWLDEPLNRSIAGMGKVVNFDLSAKDLARNRSARDEREQVAPHAPHTEEGYRRALRMKTRGHKYRTLRQVYGGGNGPSGGM